MTFTTLTHSSFDAPVVTVTLNRPDRLNAMTPKMMDELCAVVDALKQHGTRALVLTGAGRAFCAGADLKDAQIDFANPGASIEAAMGRHYNPMVRAIANAPCPTVAAVNGIAAGGGASLALLTDVVVAAKSASFAQVFAPQLGLIPDLGATWTLPRALGSARARGLALTGDRLDAETAAQWGLIWKVVDDAALLSTAQHLAEKLASGPTQAFLRVREAIAASSRNTLDEQLELERTLEGQLGATKDLQEGVASFLAKRAPNFQGR